MRARLRKWASGLRSWGRRPTALRAGLAATALLAAFFGYATALTAWNVSQSESASPHQWQLSYRGALPIFIVGLTASACLLIVQWAIPGESRRLSLRRVLTTLLVVNVLYLGIAAVASGIGAVRNGTDSEQVAVGGTSLADFVIGALVLAVILGAGARLAGESSRRRRATGPERTGPDPL